MSLKQRIRRVMRVQPIGKFQVEGVRFIEQHGGRAILGDDMGLGKTYQIITYLALHKEARPAIIVVPASVKWKWQRELKKFAGIRSTVLEGFKRFGLTGTMAEIDESDTPSIHFHDTERWFNSKEKRRAFISEHHHRLSDVRLKKRKWPKTKKVVIINFDILEDWMPYFFDPNKFPTPAALIIDECQKCKSMTADRTKFCRQIGKRVSVLIPASGTPIKNRPLEFFPMLNLVAPQKFPSLHKYAFRYCAPKLNFRGQWDFRGASNLDELNIKLKSIMIRRMKKDVLKQMPDRVRGIIPVKLSNEKEYRKAESSVTDWLLEHRDAAAAKRAKGAEKIVQLNILRQLSGMGKVKTVIEWINDFLEQTDDKKFVLFGIHKAVIAELVKKFPHASVIDGSVTGKKRQHIVDDFNRNKKTRLFFGNIDAAGEAIDLTSADTMGFIQYGWTPGEHTQCEDRLIRYGQKSKVVNAYYFTGKDTTDGYAVDMIQEKTTIVGNILDGQRGKKSRHFKESTLADYIVEKLIQKRGN